MSENVLNRLFSEIDDARDKVYKAMALAREGRGVALEQNDLPMTKLLKEIEFILKNVLEE